MSCADDNAPNQPTLSKLRLNIWRHESMFIDIDILRSNKSRDSGRDANVNQLRAVWPVCPPHMVPRRSAIRIEGLAKPQVKLVYAAHGTQIKLDLRSKRSQNFVSITLGVPDDN